MSLHYVPAGVEQNSGYNAQLSYKLVPSKNESTGFGKKYKRWNTHDRIVTQVASSSAGGVFTKVTGDVAVPISSALFMKSCGITKILANPVEKRYYGASFKHSKIESIVDSGGFQMLSGVTDFVNPDDVIERYNECADVGMPLDLPVRSAYESTYWDSVSRLIKANDEYIEPKLKTAKLALISHGTSLELRKRRLDILDRKAEVVAIAGLNIQPLPGQDGAINNIQNLMYVVNRYRSTARYFHVLGVTSKYWMFIYALLSESGYVKEIGADSVSHRLSALTGLYETVDYKAISVPKNQKFWQPIQCGCPVCVTVSDIRLLNNAVALESHNLWIRVQQTKFAQTLAKAYLEKQVTTSEIYEFLGSAMSINADKYKFDYMVKYVTKIIDMDKFFMPPTSKKFSTLLSVASSTNAKATNYDKIIKGYEKFHGKKFL